MKIWMPVLFPPEYGKTESAVGSAMDLVILVLCWRSYGVSFAPIISIIKFLGFNRLTHTHIHIKTFRQTDFADFQHSLLIFTSTVNTLSRARFTGHSHWRCCHKLALTPSLTMRVPHCLKRSTYPRFDSNGISPSFHSLRQAVMFYSSETDREEEKEKERGRKHKSRGGGDRQHSRQCGLFPSIV